MQRSGARNIKVNGKKYIRAFNTKIMLRKYKGDVKEIQRLYSGNTKVISRKYKGYIQEL